MIVVEGPDGAGKSTLVNQIAHEFRLDIGERGTKDRDKLYSVTRADTVRAFSIEMECELPPLVWDRLGPWSDPIYCKYSLPVRKCAFTPPEVDAYIHMAHRLSIVIVCLPALHVVQDNVSKSHQMKGVTEHIDHIYGEYSLLRALRYDYTEAKAKDFIMARVQDYLTDREDRENLANSAR